MGSFVTNSSNERVASQTSPLEKFMTHPQLRLRRLCGMAQPAMSNLKQADNFPKKFPFYMAKVTCPRGLPAHTRSAALEAIEDKRLRKVVLRVQKCISTRGSKTALGITHIFLANPKRVRSSFRTDFFRHTVDSFLNAGEWDAAYDLYRRMREEAIPERAGVLRLLLAKSVKMRATGSNVDQALRDAITTLEKVDECELQALLAHLIREKTDIFVIRKAVAKFRRRKSQNWTPGWKTYALLAQAEAQSGYDFVAYIHFKKARRLIGQMKQQGQLTRKAHHDAKQELYTNLFVGHAAFKHNRPLLFNRLLVRMRRDYTTFSQRICNIMIELHAKRGRGANAFKFYRSMKQCYPAILPSSTTFHHLFSLLTTPHHFPWRSRNNGRGLFQDMLTQHARNTNSWVWKPSNVMNTSVLNAALLMFMWRRDYAAATVTMKTFSVCSITPNAKTHTSVVDPILQRIRKELLPGPCKSQVLWSDRMLGEIVRLWDGPWRYHDFSVKLLETVRKLSRSVSSAGVDIGMLLALLRRAIISSANLWPGRDSTAEDAAVEKAITRAHAKMLPEGIDVRYLRITDQL